tara:strand:+ start:3367 stop:4752 length:1386 start_codon:yes stop_codon:yes gene_type:complete
MIPKIIHQIWKTETVPPEFYNFCASWKSHHKSPEWTYKLWTDNEIDWLIKGHFPEYYDLMKSISIKIIYFDIARYIILWVYGGYYVDLDVECFQKIPYDNKTSLYLTEEHVEHATRHNMNKLLTNWFIGATRKHNFIYELIHRSVKPSNDQLKHVPLIEIPLYQSGPMLVTNLYNEEFQNEATIFQYTLTNPIHKNKIWSIERDEINLLKNEFHSDCFCMHYYIGTWWRKQTIPAIVVKPYIFTIVTPTIGRPSLLELKDKLSKEKVPFVHFIMWDTKRCPDALDPKTLEDSRTYCYEMKHPTYAKNNARLDVWLRALGAMMAKTPYIKFCDDDTWPEENHLEKVWRHMIKHNLDYTYCIRRMWTPSPRNEIIGIDNFEATGEINKFGYNLIDNSSLFVNQKAARVVSQVFMNNQIYGDDRLTYEPLKKYCKGLKLDEVLTNHRCQPHLETFFKSNCIEEL